MKLSAWMKARNMTLEAFGQLVDADKSTVSRWADGSVVPRPAKQREIAEVTGNEVLPNDFVGSLDDHPIAAGVDESVSGPRAA